jgi:hypothetical protein
METIFDEPWKVLVFGAIVAVSLIVIAIVVLAGENHTPY